VLIISNCFDYLRSHENKCLLGVEKYSNVKVCIAEKSILVICMSRLEILNEFVSDFYLEIQFV